MTSENMQTTVQLSEEEENFCRSYREDLDAVQPEAPGEKKALFAKLSQGDTLAKGRLTELYLATVLETAMAYAGQGVMLSDLVQEGNIALMLSLESLNAESPDMGQDVCEEQVCAAIRSSMQETLEEQELLKSANDTIVTKVNLISQGVSNLTEELDRKVTVEKLAAYLNMPEDEVADILRLAGEGIEVEGNHHDHHHGH